MGFGVGGAMPIPRNPSPLLQKKPEKSQQGVAERADPNGNLLHLHAVSFVSTSSKGGEKSQYSIFCEYLGWKWLGLPPCFSGWRKVLFLGHLWL